MEKTGDEQSETIGTYHPISLKVSSRRPRGTDDVKDQAIHASLAAVSLVSFFVLGLVFLFLFANSILAFTDVGLVPIVTGTNWNPTGVPPLFGIVPLMVGTLMVSGMAAAIAVPIGLGATIYLAEVAHPRIRAVLKPTIELLAGIPSVIYGLFALLFLASQIKTVFNLTTGWNALNGAIMLAVLMVPIMVSLSEDAINSVPKDLREAALALGATRWEMMRNVVVPAALSGVVAAIMLAWGRAVGETMVVLMATGNSPQLTFNPLQSVQTMPATIAIETGESVFGSVHYSSLFVIGVVLFVITLGINSIAELVLAKYGEVYR